MAVALIKARRIQEELRKRVILKDSVPGDIKIVAGTDVAFRGDLAVSCCVVVDYMTLEPLEIKTAISHVTFPYIPTFLSFREAKPILKAISQLESEPDVIMFDGQGIAHPLRLGIASHVGVLLDKPTIGVAKSRLVGSYESVPDKVGDYTLLKDGEDIIGAVLRTKRNCKPLFVSPGHKISLETSIRVVMRTVSGHKLPEPLRLAHQHANMAKSHLIEK